MAKDAITTNVVTGKVRFSYVHVFEPSSIDPANEPKYSVSILIPKSDKQTLDKIKPVVDALKEQAKAKYGKLPVNFKTPLRDGDAEKGEDEAYEGHFFMNASSKTKPGVVKRSKIKGQVESITDESEFYSGCYGFADVNFYLFDKAGNKGIACGLNNVMKSSDGDSLAGKRSAAAAFGELEMDDEDDSSSYLN